MELIRAPPVCRMQNYKSYEDHQEKSAIDIDRQEAAGFLEKLNYNPTIINAQGGVYDVVKDKYRPVMDGRRSGLNACIRPRECRYDMLRDLLRVLKKGDRLGAFDLKDAFYFWPREQRFCDYQGVRGPKTRPGCTGIVVCIWGCKTPLGSRIGRKE